MGKGKEVKYKRAKVWFTAIHGVLGMFIFTYNMGVFTSSQPCVAASLGWGEKSQTYIAIISALVPLGALCGAMTAGYLSTHFGHRKNICIADLLIILASLITIIPFTLTFGLGRFLSGVGIGIFSVLCPLYLSEISPSDISGKIGSLISIFGCLGSLSAFSFALVLPTEDFLNDPLNNFWIFMFLFQGIVALAQLSFFVFHFKHETPLWLLSRGKDRKALTSLKFLYKDHHALELLENLQTSPLLQKNDSLENSSFYENSWKDLLTFSPSTQKAMRLGILLSVAQQFSGINAIISYATTLFVNFGSGLLVARIFTVLTGLLKFLSCFCLMPLLDWAGRKKVLVFGCVGMSFCLVMVGILINFNVFYLIPFLFIEMYLAFFVNSIGPICWLYSGEVLCSKGMSLCTAVNWFSAFLVVLFFPLVTRYFGLASTFWVFAAVNLLAAGYFAVDMVETKGLTKAQIRGLFQKKLA
jgi:sugar porter (SP) family MFS transporter